MSSQSLNEIIYFNTRYFIFFIDTLLTVHCNGYFWDIAHAILGTFEHLTHDILYIFY